MEHEVLDLEDRPAGIQLLGTRVRAVHDAVAAEEAVGVVQVADALLRHLVTRVHDPAVGLLQHYSSVPASSPTHRTEVLVGVPPVGGAGRGAAVAEDALVQTVQPRALLRTLQILAGVVRAVRVLLLQPRLDVCVLLVGVCLVYIGAVRPSVPITRSLMTNMWGSGRSVTVFESRVRGVRQASPFSPLMFIEQEPQMPSRHDLWDIL